MKRLALIGYGKMGRLLERLAPESGFEVALKLDVDNNAHGRGLTPASVAGVDVAVEFTTPEAAAENVLALARLNVPMVCGTTGWHARLAESVRASRRRAGRWSTSPNFSIGVNVFQRVVAEAARRMAQQPAYEAWAWEIHHSHKKDAPSGTLLKLVDEMRRAGLHAAGRRGSNRAGADPGHARDRIRLGRRHHHAAPRGAQPRRFRARGAVGRQWVKGRKGVFTSLARSLVRRVKEGCATHVHRMRHCTGHAVHGATVRLNEDALRNLVRRQIDGGHPLPGAVRHDGREPHADRAPSSSAWSRSRSKRPQDAVPVVAGCGGYNTAEVIALARELEAMGVDGAPLGDAVLQQADAGGAVPALQGDRRRRPDCRSSSTTCQGRTGVNVEPATLVRLAAIDEHRRREGGLGQHRADGERVRQVPEGFSVLSGDDAITLPLIALGGAGIISVASNEIPDEMAAARHAACLAGDFAEARAIQREVPAADGGELRRVESDPGEGGDGEDGAARAGTTGCRCARRSRRTWRESKPCWRDLGSRGRDAGTARSRSCFRTRRRPTGPRSRPLFSRFKEALNAGAVRAAEPDPEAPTGWRVNPWVKKGILLGFRMGAIVDMSIDRARQPWFDKATYPVKTLTVPKRRAHRAGRVVNPRRLLRRPRASPACRRCTSTWAPTSATAR